MNPNSLTPEEYAVWDIVKDRPGPENAIRQKVLAQMIHIPVREVRMITLSLDEKKYPVATTTRPPYGVYRIETPKQRDQYVASLRSRAFETLHRAKLVEAVDFLEFGDGQLRLF